MKISMNTRWVTLLIIFGLFVYVHGISQTKSLDSIADRGKTITLDSILLSVPIIRTSLKSSVFAIDLVNSPAIKTSNTDMTVNHLLNQVSGVNSSNNEDFAQDLRISIRGFGARSAFGTRGVKLLIDGIPETTPDGTTSAEMLDILSISNLEVIKGAVSGLYGNSSGGVILAKTTIPSEKGITLRGSGGSFNTQRYMVNLSRATDRNYSTLQASYLNRDGYRTHSHAQKIYVLGMHGFHINDKQQIKLDFRYVARPKNLSPGGIAIADVEKDRTTARDRNIELNSSEEVSHIRLATTYNYDINESHDFQTKIWYVNRNLTGLIPTNADGGYSLLNRNFFGGNAIWNIRFDDVQLNIDTGYQAQYDSRDRYNVENLGIKGIQRSEQDEEYHNINVALRGDADLSKSLKMQTGLRYDHISMSIEDLFLSNGNQTLAPVTYDVINSYFGFSLDTGKIGTLYGNVGTTFETPTLNEVSKNGFELGANEKLDPQKSLGFEFGLRRFSPKWHYQLTLYQTKTDNEIIEQELTNAGGEEASIYRNAVKTSRVGMEANLGVRLTKRLQFTTALNWADIIYEDYNIDGDNFDGLNIPGIPKHQLSIQLHYETTDNLVIRLEFLNKGTIYANNKNSVEVDPIKTLNFRVQKEWTFNHFRVKPFITLNNLFGEEYYSNIRINAFGNRFYEPAPLFNISMGVTINL